MNTQIALCIDSMVMGLQFLTTQKAGRMEWSLGRSVLVSNTFFFYSFISI